MRGVCPAAGPRLRELVAFLRGLKESSGLTYEEMARRTGSGPLYCGASTLAEAASGSRVPRWKAVDAYARGAGYVAPRSRRGRGWALWRAAAAEAGHSRVVGRGRRLREVRTVEHFGEYLSRLRDRSGLSLGLLEMVTEDEGLRVPRSTCDLILKGRVLATGHQLAVLLAAFGVKDVKVASIQATRDRLAMPRSGGSWLVAPADVGYVCLDGHPAVEAYLERMQRDEEIKRRTGQLAEDEDYNDWRLERTLRGASRFMELDDDEIERMQQEAEEAARRAGYEPGALRAELEAMAARARPVGD